MHTHDRRRRNDVAHTSISLALALLTIAFLLVAESLQSEERAWHEQMIDMLRSHDEVLPPTFPVHPVEGMYNREAVIPPQCYTRTEGQHNPCYVCHQNERPGAENSMNDGDLQVAYSFSDLGKTNRWKNVFEDRTARILRQSDDDILSWMAADNYDELAPRLTRAGFKGWIPDLKDLGAAAGAFDELGFARDGSQWVAFNYKPMPSTFWPTNGSMDDVMIRLPPEYRQTRRGEPSREIYLANLSIAEAVIKGLERISTPPIDEVAAGEDVNGDGTLGVIHAITDVSSWVGKARGFHLQRSVYPQGTEFLHTVRYVDVDERDEIRPSQRLKEVRYMRKAFLLTPDAIAEAYREEGYHKTEGLLPLYVNRGQEGIDNEMGWLLQSFIENGSGRLRVATFEEHMFCMGCHSSIGSTIDKTFSFARKVDGAMGWGYINLRGMPDAPSRGETEGEILTYFRRVGGGSEFRDNTEMQSRWFHADGTVDVAKVRGAKDVHALVKPSRRRALELAKAYRTIVSDQDFIYGRDATVSPVKHVYDEVPENAPVLPAKLFFPWDIRLDW